MTIALRGNRKIVDLEDLSALLKKVRKGEATEEEFKNNALRGNKHLLKELRHLIAQAKRIVKKAQVTGE